MVFSGEGEDYTATTERRKTRHNFTLPDLKWGVQRSLRCMNPPQSNGGDQRLLPSPSKLDGDVVENRNRREEGIEEYGEKREVSPPGRGEAEAKPWNLRKRRREACKAPPVTGSGNCDDDASSKLVSTLSKKEMEDDYMTMMGQRPPRRPKKRLRTLQKQIDLLHPALYFTQITEDIYEVPDENGK